MPQEIESRYLAPERALYERLLQREALGPYALIPQGWQRVRDCYLDTADLALSRQGWACRVRSEDGLRHSVTLKGPGRAQGPGVARDEYIVSLPCEALDPARWPVGHLRERVLGLTGGAPLEPLVRVRQRRYHLAAQEGPRLAARLSLDRMRVRAQGLRQERYLVECELLGEGRPADLMALDALLTGECGLVPEPRSKHELALGLLEQAGASPQPDDSSFTLRPKDPPARAAAKILAQQTERLLAHEPGVREGRDPEAVHDMRVATRRMRSALVFFGPFLRDSKLDRLAKRLRRLGRLLGAVRDLDVALERAHAFAEAHNLSRGLAPLLAEWERQRLHHRQALLCYLDSPGHARWLGRWQALLMRLRNAPGKGQPRIGLLAPLLVYVHWRAVWVYDPFVAGAPIETLHALRIECKRLRYGLEFCADVLPPTILAWIPEITAMQDHLGALNDHAIAIGMLDAVATEPSVAGAAEGIAAYRAHCQAQMTLLAQAVPERWAHLARPETQRAFEGLIRR